MKSKVIEFKYTASVQRHDTNSTMKQWNTIIESYFKLLYGKSTKVNIKYEALHIDDIMPYTSNVRIVCEVNDKFAFRFYMYGQNNCCGAMSVSDTLIAGEYQDKKLGTLLQHFKNDFAYSNRINVLYCTDVTYYKPDSDKVPSIKDVVPYLKNHKLLLNTGWELVDAFHNVKSNNIVGMFSKKTNNKNSNKEVTMKVNLEANKIIKIKNLTIGCDPELFLKSKETGEYVPSYSFIKGDKQAPTFITNEGHNIQCDNVMVEYGVPPSKTAEQFVNNNLLVQRYIKDKVAEPNNLEMVIAPYVEFEANNLKDDRAGVFGCDPDFNAWQGGRPNTVGRANPVARCAGGHIHVGYDGHNEVTNHEIIKALDLYLSVPLVLMEPDNLRKEMYGKAGAYRNQPWGVEYRVTSNYIYSSPELMKWAFEQVNEAINFLNAGGFKDLDTYPYNIVNIINNNDKGNAQALVKKLNIKTLTLVK